MQREKKDWQKAAAIPNTLFEATFHAPSKKHASVHFTLPSPPLHLAPPTISTFFPRCFLGKVLYPNPVMFQNVKCDFVSV